VLGIVPDDGDEHNLDDLDLLESPRCEMSDAILDYEIEHGRATRPQSGLRQSCSVENELDLILDDDEDYNSEEEDEYAMRSVDVAMSRGADAPRDAGRLRLAQTVIHEDDEDFNECHRPVLHTREPMLASHSARPKSAVDRPKSGKTRDALGSKGSKSKRATAGSGNTKSGKQMSVKSMKHKDLVAEALAKDPKSYRQTRGPRQNVEWTHRPTSAQQREMYLGTTYVE